MSGRELVVLRSQERRDQVLRTALISDNIMTQRVITIVLLIGLFFSLSVLASGLADWRMPDNQQGYAPKQPVDYSHRLHAGELNIDCRFCHTAASESQHAGIPASDVCMKCHNFVTASFDAVQQEAHRASDEQRVPEPIVSDDLRAFYSQALGLDEKMPAKDLIAKLSEISASEDLTQGSIDWIRVHNLPDYVTFNHQAHVSAGVSCQKCHGAVESMERVRQHSNLSMGWCVNCHRETNEHGILGQQVNASLNCTTCHH